MASLLLQVAFDETDVIPSRHEADFLALWFFGDGNAEAARDVPDLLLPQFAERKIGTRKLVLREPEEKIRLVLRFIHGAQQFAAAGFRIVAHAGVVARGDPLSADLTRGGGELIEHDGLVTNRA